MSGKKPSRREFISTAARGAGAAGVGAVLWAWVVRGQTRAAPFALRPPGARAEPDFLSRCIKCGQCVVDCPYDTLKLAAVGDPYPIGSPYFVPRETPCYMCPEIPCVRACPTGALDPDLVDITRADMGVAVIVDQENCLSYRGLRCEICHRECPVQNQAITIAKHPRKISKHAVFVPVVHGDACTGCGVCERACPVPDAAIKVLPRELGRARAAEHYRFGEAAGTPITQEFEPAPGAPDEATGDVDEALEYLGQGTP